MTQNTLIELKKLREQDKFADKVWEGRGLNPSPMDVIQKMDTLVNKCIDELIEAFSEGENEAKLKKVLSKGLSRCAKKGFDTEEKEFICDYFYELATILTIDFKDNLNEFLYGKEIVDYMKMMDSSNESEKIIETLLQNCTKCSARFETFILAKDSTVNNARYDIIKCIYCNALNLLDRGNSVTHFQFENYVFVHYLDKSEFTKEQAEEILQELK